MHTLCSVKWRLPLHMSSSPCVHWSALTTLAFATSCHSSLCTMVYTQLIDLASLTTLASATQNQCHCIYHRTHTHKLVADAHIVLSRHLHRTLCCSCTLYTCMSITTRTSRHCVHQIVGNKVLITLYGH